MNEKLESVLNSWNEQIELKNAYVFGCEEVDLPYFKKLFEDTFECFQNFKNEFIYKNVWPENVFVTFDYLRLLSLVSQYSVGDSMFAEVEDKSFTTVCLIAQKLVEYATFTGDSSFENGKTEYRDSSNEAQGVLEFYRCDYPFLADQKPFDHIYKYNIHTGDFGEVSELAQQLF